MAAQAKYQQLQFEGTEDPTYLHGGLADIVSSAKIIEAPEGDDSIAEFFFGIGGRVYELFRASEKGSMFELDGPGFRTEVYVEGYPQGDEDARKICMIVLEYAAGRVEEGELFQLASMTA